MSSMLVYFCAGNITDEENLVISGTCLSTFGLILGVVGSFVLACKSTDENELCEYIEAVAGIVKLEAKKANTDAKVEAYSTPVSSAAPRILIKQEAITGEIAKNNEEGEDKRIDNFRKLKKSQQCSDFWGGCLVAFGFLFQLIAIWLQFGSYYA